LVVGRASASTTHATMTRMTSLEQTVRELDIYVSADGWDQPTRLFAVADTQLLIAREPALRAQLESATWTTIEQDQLPPHADLDELLRGLTWPASVEGVAVSAERVMVAPDAAGDLPSDPGLARIEAAGHPRRHELRVTMAVLRGGERCTVLRLREHDSPESAVVGEDLVSGLGDLLLHTLTGEA
jgi:hypothetical protein